MAEADAPPPPFRAADRLLLPTRRAALAGRVSDARTGRPLAGAVATITDAPEAFLRWAAIRRKEAAGRTPPGPPPDAATTAADGWFRFLDLPPGAYAVSVSLPQAGSRYGGATVRAKVTEGGRWADASAALAPTTIRGTVTGPDGEPLALAEVLVKGSLERTHTGPDGAYVLSGVEAGERTVRATARGMAPAEGVAKLPAPGKARRVDLALSAG